MHVFGAVSLVCLLCLFSAKSFERHEYCILGAGPGGLQVGQFMHARRWDYVILERNGSPGSFFEKYPRHRGLISLNKVHTGRNSSEFNLRHDWNSLLETDVPPMTKRTSERFPRAEVLLDYIKDFARRQEMTGNVRYNITVTKIERNMETKGFLLLLNSTNGGDARLECDVVVHAGGNWRVNQPQNLQDQGFRIATTYETLPSSGYESFAGRRVLVVGLGNAAMETADALAPHVAYVHTIPGRSTSLQFPMMAYETRYVGSLRTIRSQTLDAYLLKSLDGGFASYHSADNLILHRCGAERKERCLFSYDPSDGTASFTFPRQSEPAAAPLLRKIQEKGLLVSVDHGPWHAYVQRSIAGKKERKQAIREVEKVRAEAGAKPTVAALERHRWMNMDVENIAVYVNASLITDEHVDVLVELSQFSTPPYPLVYDEVILCLGFRHEWGIYDPSVLPIFQTNNRYPVLTEDYESVNVPGLFYAGSLAHGKDFKKAAGGFIHGFRYTAKALVNILAERRNSTEHWPSRTYDGVARMTGSGNPSMDADALAQNLLLRLNEGSAAYQMVHVLGDGILLQCDQEHATLNATYFEDLPLERFHKRFRGFPRLTASFGYGGNDHFGQQRSLEHSVTAGTDFEGYISYFPGDCTHDWRSGPKILGKEGLSLPENREVLSLKETLSTQWQEKAFLPSVHMFLTEKLHDALMKPGGWHRSFSLPNVSIVDDADRPEWHLGNVDMWVKNLANETVVVGSRHPRPRDQEIKREAVLAPGEGLRIRVGHLDELFAKTPDGISLTKQIVDLSGGIVQNFLIWPAPGDEHAPICPSAGSSQVCFA